MDKDVCALIHAQLTLPLLTLLMKSAALLEAAGVKLRQFSPVSILPPSTLHPHFLTFDLQNEKL